VVLTLALAVGSCTGDEGEPGGTSTTTTIATTTEAVGGEPPPGWDFFDEVIHVEWTGDYVIDLPDDRFGLGPRTVTLADGRVLHLEGDHRRQEWCRPIDPEVWSQDVEGCWIGGIEDENGRVLYWTVFEVRERKSRGEVVGHGFRVHRRTPFQMAESHHAYLRGYPISVAEDVHLSLHNCKGDPTSFYFETDRRDITAMSCWSSEHGTPSPP
jgi:hypothetical protein